MNSVYKSVYFAGIPLFSGSIGRLLDLFQEHLEKQTTMLRVCTPNPEQIVLADHDPQFRSCLQAADVNLPDGSGVVWAVRYLTGNTLHRIPGRVVFHALLEIAKALQLPVGLVGGREGVAASIVQQYGSPDGWFADSGPAEIETQSPAELKRLLERIHTQHPQLLFLAFGAPHQERWLIDNSEALAAAGVRIAMVVGGAFDYEAGKSPRVPDWVASHHLEWLFRLLHQPWRASRQLRGVLFFIRVFARRYKVEMSEDYHS